MTQSNSLTTTVDSTESQAIELVLMAGDLAKLSSQQRVVYYNAVCNSIGVNPLTRPFEYIVLNNKLQLYARRDCTDQLRSNRKVSIRLVGRETINGVYVVTAQATTQDGRADESTGAVTVEGLKGESLANAFLKAETKAKRRVTLSICGLGMIDESESVPGARVVEADPVTGELLDGTETKIPDFASEIDSATDIAHLTATAKAIESATKAGLVNAEARKALGEKYTLKLTALRAVKV